MRNWRRLHWFLALAIIGNLAVFFYLSEMQKKLDEKKDNQFRSSDIKEDSLTIIIRDFEMFDNDIESNIKSMKSVLPDIEIVIVADTMIYPPINYSPYAKLLLLDTPPDKNPVIPSKYIQSDYIMILPDSCTIDNPAVVQTLISFHKKQLGNVKMVAWNAFALRDVQCLTLNVDLKRWTLQYANSQNYCSALDGNFGLLMKSDAFLSLPYPFKRPMSSSLFIQTAIRGWKIAMYNQLTMKQSRKLYQDGHINWKHMTLDQDRMRDLYAVFGIKAIFHADGGEEWHGCRKKSNRCFGTIHNSMPEYLYQGRWTPPCCLKALRATAQHVISMLERQEIRYWLEGGSLLGAARHGDIIPWDYDVDIGIYQDDISKSKQLLRCNSSSFIDDEGFLWEKASEGDFFRVHFSQSNRLHVDIYPFHPVNGTMTKSTWMKTHRQDMPFPEHFLKPLVRIGFIDMKVLAPNNWKSFLEMKFGQGVIMTPKYPNMQLAT